MPLEEELILAYLKIINFLLNLNLKIGQRLVFYKAKYSAQEEIETLTKSQNFDLRGISNRVKNLLIHDQDIIDNRMEICNGCEFKMGLNCKKCGCFIHAKVRSAISRCPIGKWEREYDFMKGKPINGTHASS